MKGIVFTEYIDFLDNKFGMEKTEEIIQAANPESTAAYTVVGNYPYQEMPVEAFFNTNQRKT